MATPVTLIAPSEVNPPGDIGPFPFDMFGARCLAQGDSWFSFGALPPTLTTSVLRELRLKTSTVIVNCARPGAVLHHMTDTSTERRFLNLLTGAQAMKWHAILISGGGNDLIDAVGAGPQEPPNRRLLATPAERAASAVAAPGVYISEPGWAVFEDHLGAVFNHLVDQRDSGQNRHVPLLLHTYAPLMPRPAGAGAGFGPWLQPACDAFAVPQADRLALATLLIDRLAALLQGLIAQRTQQDPGCALHLVDTRAAGLVLSDPAATGESGDFINEIHPTRQGYRKVAALWQAQLDQLL